MIALGAAVAFYVVPPMLLAAKAAIVAFAPFLVLGAIVAGLAGAFALLYDDIVNFTQGNDSLIGQLSEKWPAFGVIVRAIASQFNFLMDAAKAVASFLVGMFKDPSEAFAKFKQDMEAGVKKLIETYPGLSAAIGAVSAAFEIAGNTIEAVWESIAIVVRTVVDGIMSGISAISEGFGKIKSLFGLGGVTVKGLMEGKQAVSQASAVPLANQTSNSISNSRTVSKSTNVQVGKVEVKTAATDAEGISKAIGGSIQSQMQQAATNFDDGVLA
jgi:hypothetical protein